LNDFKLSHRDLTNYNGNKCVPIEGEATIYRKSTGIRKIYKTGHLSLCLYEFENDLKNGAFNLNLA